MIDGHHWTSRRTWILCTEFSRGRCVVPIWNPMSTTKMALITIILTITHMIHAELHCYRAMYKPKQLSMPYSCIVEAYYQSTRNLKYI